MDKRRWQWTCPAVLDIIKSYEAVTGSWVKGTRCGHGPTVGRTYQQLEEGGREGGGGGEVVKSGVEAEQLVGESENHMVGSCKEGDHTTRSLDRGTRIKRNNLTSHLNAFTHSFTSSASHSPDRVRRRIIVVAANLDKLHNPRLR